MILTLCVPGHDFVEIKPGLFNSPHPLPLSQWQAFSLGSYSSGWYGEGADAMALSLNSTACIPLISGKDQSTRWLGGGAVS
jgi:hypothetical protein